MTPSTPRTCMALPVREGIEVLRKDGPLTAIEKSILYTLRRSNSGDEIIYRLSIRDVQSRMETEEDLDDILDTVLNAQPGYHPYQVRGMQLRDEIETFAEYIKERNPRNVLEIGTAYGGSLYIWSRHLDTVKSVTSLDLPKTRPIDQYNQRKTSLLRSFAPSKNMKFVRGNSHDEQIYDEVSEKAGQEVDFLFIDGDHSYEGVKDDFQKYRKLVSEDGVIAFHDIVEHPNDEATVEERRNKVDDLEDRHLYWSDNHRNCYVNQFWEEIREEYETKEIISHPQQTWGGIGVVTLGN